VEKAARVHCTHTSYPILSVANKTLYSISLPAVNLKPWW